VAGQSTGPPIKLSRGPGRPLRGCSRTVARPWPANSGNTPAMSTGRGGVWATPSSPQMVCLNVRAGWCRVPTAQPGTETGSSQRPIDSRGCPTVIRLIATVPGVDPAALVMLAAFDEGEGCRGRRRERVFGPSVRRSPPPQAGSPSSVRATVTGRFRFPHLRPPRGTCQIVPEQRR
jgi:hypothetical protein